MVVRPDVIAGPAPRRGATGRRPGLDAARGVADAGAEGV